MTPAHVDNLWQRAVRLTRADGGVTMHAFAELVRREAWNDAVRESAAAVQAWAVGAAMTRVCRAIAQHVKGLELEGGP